MNQPDETPSTVFDRAVGGQRRALGRLLTWIERGGAAADEIAALANAAAGRAHVVGVTGAPGAGKSTLVARLVQELVGLGRRPAVLAVDPSSPLTGGAILGDRVRMGDAESDQVFIRSMATRGHSGGLALAVPAAVRLFDAVGYDPVIIETVGVGQVEVDVVAAADSTVVVVNPGWGDAVQANKAGLLEVADVFAVNKADRPGAAAARRDLDLMLDLSHVTGAEDDTGWRPPVVLTEALDGIGVEGLWAAAADHYDHLIATNRLGERRRRRVRSELAARVELMVSDRITWELDEPFGQELVEAVKHRRLPPALAADRLLDRLGAGPPPEP